MCLLVTISRDHPETPLVVAANRDELLERPAVAMAVLQPSGPRILGGRDELAGGTWLAVNEAGVVAGLTNQPATAGRDPTKRSRGELPLILAQHLDARRAVESFVASVRPSDYNPAWLLVGDRRSLFYLDLGDGDSPRVTELAPGTHVLENRPLGGVSPKVDHVREQSVPARRHETEEGRLEGVGRQKAGRDMPVEVVYRREARLLKEQRSKGGRS